MKTHSKDNNSTSKTKNQIEPTEPIEFSSSNSMEVDTSVTASEEPAAVSNMPQQLWCDQILF